MSKDTLGTLVGIMLERITILEQRVKSLETRNYELTGAFCDGLVAIVAEANKEVSNVPDVD